MKSATQYSRAESVLSQFFKSIEDKGGAGTCRILYRRSPAAGTTREQINKLRIQVEITVPFTHSGHDLLARGVGGVEPKTEFLVNSVEDITYPLQQGRMSAFKKAVDSLAQNAKQEMLRVRPTTSNRKQQRKVRGLLKSIEVAEFARDV